MSITSKAVRTGVRESSRLIVDRSIPYDLLEKAPTLPSRNSNPDTSRYLASLNQKLTPRRTAIKRETILCRDGRSVTCHQPAAP